MELFRSFFLRKYQQKYLSGLDLAMVLCECSQTATMNHLIPNQQLLCCMPLDWNYVLYRLSTFWIHPRTHLHFRHRQITMWLQLWFLTCDNGMYLKLQRPGRVNENAGRSNPNYNIINYKDILKYLLITNMAINNLFPQNWFGSHYFLLIKKKLDQLWLF